MLFDAHVHDKWSYEQLPMVQRIMNTVEKTSTVMLFHMMAPTIPGRESSILQYEGANTSN